MGVVLIHSSFSVLHHRFHLLQNDNAVTTIQKFSHNKQMFINVHRMISNITTQVSDGDVSCALPPSFTVHRQQISPCQCTIWCKENNCADAQKLCDRFAWCMRISGPHLSKGTPATLKASIPVVGYNLPRSTCCLVT